MPHLNEIVKLIPLQGSVPVVNFHSFYDTVHTFSPKCSLLEWAEIPLGYLLMGTTDKGISYPYVHKDSLHTPLRL